MSIEYICKTTTGMSRNFCGVDNASLYEVSNVKTKKLIEDYRETVEGALLNLSRNEEMSIEKRLDFFTKAQTMHGKTALVRKYQL
jgi:hypothetical protein